MKHSTTNLVRIHGAKEGKPLTEAQKKFNRLSKKIDKLRSRLAEWQNDFPQYQQKFHLEYSAVNQQYRERQLEMAQLLDRALDQKTLTRQEKKKVEHLILNLVDALMVEHPSDTVIALHDKYSETSHKEKSEHADAMYSVFEEIFGTPFDDEFDLDSPDDVFARTDEVTHGGSRQHSRGTGRKPSAAQLAKAERVKAEKQDIHKSLQTVYRKLAAALHPDRERDTSEHERKTELMQRANIAYKKKDLLQLLELQLEIEQIDSSHIDAISDRNLQHYIEILKEQCRELEYAVEEVLFSYGSEFALSDFRKMPVKKVIAQMEQDLADLRFSLESIQLDLPLFQDISHIKSWLRDYRLSSSSDIDKAFELAMDEMQFSFDDFNIDDFRAINIPKTKRAKKKKTKKRKNAGKRKTR